jgi:hypothetical protein
MDKEDMLMIVKLRNTMIVIAAVIATGCVSSGTFEKMQAVKNEEIAEDGSGGTEQIAGRQEEVAGDPGRRTGARFQGNEAADR